MGKPDELLLELEIPMYVRDYIKSNSLRPRYYIRSHYEGSKAKKKLPEKFCSKSALANGSRILDITKFDWKAFKVIRNGKVTSEQFLVDNLGVRVASNEDIVGTQSIGIINGQALYSQTVQEHERNKIMTVIKKSFSSYVKDIVPIKRFPIRIYVLLCDTIIDDEFSNGQDWDVDNRFFPYAKAFADVLKHEGKIPDDNRYFITTPPNATFVPVEDPEDRKLKIRIYKDNRDIILNNYLYQRKHGTALQ